MFLIFRCHYFLSGFIFCFLFSQSVLSQKSPYSFSGNGKEGKPYTSNANNGFDFEDSPGWQEFFTYGGTGSNEIEVVSRDSEGNLYAAGMYHSRLTIQGKTIQSEFLKTVFLAKFSFEGELIWLENGLSVDANDDLFHLELIHLDKNGGLYLIGAHRMPLMGRGYSFQGSSALFSLQISADGVIETVHRSEMYFDRYSSIKVFQNSLYLLQYDHISVMDLNFKNERFLFKYMEGGIADLWLIDKSIFFVGVSSNGSNVGGLQCHVYKLDLNGKVIWHKHNDPHVFGDVGKSRVRGYYISADSIGNLFLTGSFHDKMKWGSDSIASEREESYFILKLDSMGQSVGLKEMLWPKLPAITFNDSYMYASVGNEGPESKLVQYTKDGDIVKEVQVDVIENVNLVGCNERLIRVADNGYNCRVSSWNFDLDMDWESISESSAGRMKVSSLETDDENNTYVLGYNQGYSKFRDIEFEKDGMFIMKLNQDFNVLWHYHFAVLSDSNRVTDFKEFVGKIIGNRLAYNEVSQHLIFAFNYFGTVQANDQEFHDDPGLLMGSIDFNGEIHWIKSFGGLKVHDISQSDNSDIHLTGGFKGNLNINGETISSTEENGIVLELNEYGSVQWYMPIKGDGLVDNILHGIDQNNHLYVTSYIAPRKILVGDNLIELAENDGRTLFMKLTDNGELDWYRVLAGGESDKMSFPGGFLTSSNGDSYLFMVIQKGAKIDGQELSIPNNQGWWGYAKALIKFNSKGEVNWVNTFGEEGFEYNYNQMVKDSEQNIYVTSAYSGSVYLNDSLTVGNDRGVYLAKFIDNGNLSWIKTLEMSPDMGVGLAVTTEGKLVMSASYENRFESADTLIYASGWDGFMVSLQIVENSPLILEKTNLNASIYPNPAASYMRITLPEAHGVTARVSIIDLQGKSTGSYQLTDVREEVIDVSNLPKGLYIVKIKTPQGSFTKKLLK